MWTPRARRLRGLALAALLAGLTLALWPRADGGPPPEAPRDAPGAPPRTAERPSPPPPALPSPAPAHLPGGEALAAALREERVTLASRVVIEGIDTDRPWVCTGEPMALSARLGGEREPGAVTRWVWLTARGGAELHPGPMLQWRAPAAAGRYRVRFQVCRDLGGRSVGVLAEREVEVDVRACGGGERQEDAALRLGVEQRGPATFAFQALSTGRERIESYAWDFGDGTTRHTAEPRSEHTYELGGLGLQDTRSFRVKLSARSARGEALGATAFALIRGQPPGDTRHPVQLELTRARPLPDGSGWWTDVVVRPADDVDVTWERVERIIHHWDGEADITTRPWSEAIAVDEDLGHGGFRGHVTVSPSEVPEHVKQLHDFLYGRDAAGQEVVVSWSAFKREAPPTPPEAPPPPPAK